MSTTLVMLLGASTAFAAVAPAYSQAATSPLAYATPDCAKACNDAYNACRVAPNANMASCASQLASCVNYNPFDNSGSFVTPTACSSKTATATAPAYTTSTAISDCAKGCNDAYNACRVAPNANMASCASQLASCVNYNPFDNSGSFVTPTACSSKTATATAPAYTAGAAVSDCAKGCNEAYNKCRGAPDANMAFCASQLAGCLNYNPFDNSGSFVTPTACSASSASKTGAASTGAATHPGSYAPSTPTGSASGSDCAKACNEAYNKCRGAPDANMAFCASQLASCLNYNPFDNSGSFVTPTACSASSASKTGAASTAAATHPGSYAPSTPTGSASGSDCAKACNEAYNKCRGAPDANMAFCASQLASCLNYNPFDNSGSFVTPTACSAGASKPTAAGNGTSPAGSASATYSAPAQYTGGAALVGSSFMAAAAGVFALMI